MTLLKDALYNMREDSGASVDYGKGVIVGMMAALMSTGKSFDVAWEIVRKSMPQNGRLECIPATWPKK
jgi:hypothetical protein